MKYHANATTNKNQRKYIQDNKELGATKLSRALKVSRTTVYRWLNRDSLEDKNTRNNICKRLNDEIKEAVRTIRIKAKVSIYIIIDTLKEKYKQLNYYNVYKYLRSRVGLFE